MVKERKLTERQEQVLVLLLDVHTRDFGMTGNEIGLSVVLPDDRRIVAYKGWNGTAVMGPAQRVIGTINGLSKRGLVQLAPRRDGLSGTAYRLTSAGFIEARRIKGMADGVRTDLGDAKGDDEAIWVVEGYEDHDNLDAVAASDVSFPPGSTVMFPEEHEMYGGEQAKVMAVGRGRGQFDGEVTYDVVPVGAVESERVTEHDLEA